MRLVVERHLSILVRLAVFPEHDFLRLDLAFLLLGENEGHTTECKQEDKKYLHGSNLKEAADGLSIFLSVVTAY